MFNTVNTDNRLLIPLRGCVIVFTTSTVVEYVDKNKSLSIPLFSFPPPPAQCGNVFMVSFDGYLSFDLGSIVRVTDELAPFTKPVYDPSAHSLVNVADAFASKVESISPLTTTAEGDPIIMQVVYTSPDGAKSVDLKHNNGNISYFDWETTFRPGGPWKGIEYYFEFTRQL